MSIENNLMIKVFRFKGGLEIISAYEYIHTQGEAPLVRLHNPMRFGFVEGPNGTSHYLQLGLMNPLSLFKERYVDIACMEIFYTAEPSKPLLDYYNSCVSYWNDILEKDPDREFAQIKTVADMLHELSESTKSDSRESNNIDKKSN